MTSHDDDNLPTGGSETDEQNSPTEKMNSPAYSQPKVTPGGGSKKKVTKAPSLERVDEGTSVSDSSHRQDSDEELYGVRSYIHHFYERGVKDLALYEEDDDDERYLLNPFHRRRHRCNSRWWKTLLIIGIILLLSGLVGILIGYLMKPQEIIIGHAKNIDIIDRKAIVFNYNLEICKVAGLIVFCVGGLFLTLSLLIPVLFDTCCDPGDPEPDLFVRRLSTASRGLGEDDGIPATPVCASVQPGDVATALSAVSKVH